MPESAHYHPKGKMPSRYTIESHQKQRQLLPFEDARDFEESKQGFIAAPAHRKINLITPDNGEQFIVELSNDTMTTIAGYHADDVALTLIVNRRDPQVLMQLAACLTRFEIWSEILPVTKPPATPAGKDELFEDDAPMEVRP